MCRRIEEEVEHTVLSNDTKVNDLVNLTVTCVLKIAFWTLLPMGALCFTNTFCYRSKLYIRLFLKKSSPVFGDNKV